MKRRNGFVSNSSSSSFVAIGCSATKVFTEDFKREFLNKKEVTFDDINLDDAFEEYICETTDYDLATEWNDFIGIEIASGGECGMDQYEASFEELQKIAEKFREDFCLGPDVEIKLYTGERPG